MTENLPLVGAMACTQMGMMPGEVVTALTLNAAAALGRSERLGTLTPGKQGDAIVCDVADYREIFYHFGTNHVECVVKRGRVVVPA
jgi:imidazolonepropionase